MLTRPDPTRPAKIRQNRDPTRPDPTRPDPTRPDSRVHPTHGQLCDKITNLLTTVTPTYRKTTVTFPYLSRIVTITESHILTIETFTHRGQGLVTFTHLPMCVTLTVNVCHIHSFTRIWWRLSLSQISSLTVTFTHLRMVVCWRLSHSHTCR